MAEDNVQANIRIGIDTSDALVSIKNLQRQISAFHTSMANGSAANAAAASNFQKTLIDNINATKKFSATVQTVRTTTETFTNSLEKNKLSLGQYFRYAGGASKSFGRLFATEFETINKVARERVKDLQTQYIRMGRDANGAMRAIAVRPLVLDMDNLATKTAIAAQRQQLLNQLLKQGSTNLLNFGKNTQWAGRQLMVGFTIPLSVFGATAAKSFMTIEEQAIRFKRVYGDLMTDSGQTDAMLESIKTLASEFTKYGVAVDKTMGLAASAAAQGKTGADLTAQVAEATRLSVLGQVEQQQALETTISVTNAFGVAAQDLASKIDFLNAVENQTVTSIEDLTIAIPKAGPVVKQLGGDVEDLAFFLTAMKEGGINASEGANALKSGLASLINPTEKASEMLAGYGINIKKIVESNKGDVKGIVTDFATSLDKLDPLKRARAIEQLFGKFQFSRLSTLFQNVIGEGTQAQKVLELAATSSEGLAALSERELGKISESSMFKFKKSIEDIKVALAPIGETFLKLATPVIEFGTKILNSFNALDERTKNFVAGLVAVVGGIGPVLLMTFGLLANGIANIIKGFTFVKNVFNKASVSSSDLGSQISYMTSEQLTAAAVAASLDQVHGKLTQTFTAEAGAIDLYRNSLERANQVAASFNVPAVGRSRPVQKLAKGGYIAGPGTGTSDSIAAMVSDGEFIVPAKQTKKFLPLLQAIVSGNIPGFNGKNGNIVGGDQKPRYNFAHIGPGVQMPVSEALQDQGLGFTRGPRRRLETLAGVDSSALVDLKTAYGRKMETSTNINLAKRRGASAEEVGRQFSGTNIEDAYGEMFKLIGEDAKDPQLIKEFETYDKEMSARIKELQKFGIDRIVDTEEQLQALPDNQKKTTRSLEAIDKEVVDKIGKDNQRLVKSRSKALATYRDVRIGESLTPAQKSAILADPVKNKSIIRRNSRSSDEVRVGTSNQKKTAGGYGFRPDSPYRGSQAQTLAKEYGKLSATDIVAEQNKVLGQEKNDPFMLQRSEKRNSPHPQAGIDGTDDAKARIAAEQKEYKRTQRRVSGIPDGNGGMRIVAVPTGPSQAGAATTQKRSGKASRLGDLEVRQEAEKAAAAATAANTNATKEATKATRSFGSGFRNASYVISGLSGVALMFGQNMGNLTNIIFGASLAISALTTAAEINSATGFLGLGPKAAGAKGISGFFSRMVNVGGKAVMSLGRFAGVVGIAITAISGFVMLANYINDQREKERLKLEGLGDAALMTKEKLKVLGEFFGKNISKSPLERATAVIPMKQADRQQVDSLRDSQSFKDTYNNDIKSLKAATAADAKLVLESIAIQLEGSGFAKEEIDKIVKALQEESGKTQIKLDFTKISLKTESGQKIMAKNAKDLAANFAKSFTGNMEGSGIFDRPTEIGGKWVERMVPNDMLQEKLNTTSSVFSGMLSGISNAFANGVINSDQFNKSLSTVTSEIQGMPEPSQLLMLDTVLGSLDSPLAESAKKVSNLSDKYLLLKAAMLGLNTITESDIKVLNAAALQPANDLLQRLASNVRGRIQKELGATTKIFDDFAKEVEGSDYSGSDKKSKFEEAMTQISSQTSAILDQTKAFNKLKAAGYDTEEAFSIAKDPILAAALASTKVGSKNWKLLTAAIKVSKKAAEEFKKVQSQTIEGATEDFDKAYGNVTESFNALEENLQLAFNKANKTDLDLISSSESQIAALAYSIDDYNATLDDIQLQEDAINERYDKRIDALDKVQTINEEISRQQKSQLSIADALSQGDIAAAARAVQDARSEEAQANLDTQKNNLENARNAEIGGIRVGGQSRADVEKKILDLQSQIKKIEEGSLEPAQNRIRLAEEKLQKDIASLSVAGKTKDEWTLIANNIRIAKTETADFVELMEKALSAATNLKNVLAANAAGAGPVNTWKEAGIDVAKAQQDFKNSGSAFKSSGLSASAYIKAVDRGETFGFKSAFTAAGGGMVPKYFAAGGFARGTDTVPSMLTPGEFVVKKYAVQDFGTDRLKAINNGTYSGESVYNYELNVNVKSDANADDIARTVMTQIKQIDSQRLRGNRL